MRSVVVRCSSALRTYLLCVELRGRIGSMSTVRLRTGRTAARHRLCTQLYSSSLEQHFRRGATTLCSKKSSTPNWYKWHCQFSTRKNDVQL